MLNRFIGTVPGPGMEQKGGKDEKDPDFDQHNSFGIFSRT